MFKPLVCQLYANTICLYQQKSNFLVLHVSFCVVGKQCSFSTVCIAKFSPFFVILLIFANFSVIFIYVYAPFMHINQLAFNELLIYYAGSPGGVFLF